MRDKGLLSEWNDERGFGFITPDDKTGRLFVHISDFGKDGRRPALGDRVTYLVEKAGDGRARAVDVRIEGFGFAYTPLRPRTLFAIAGTILFYAALIFSVANGHSTSGVLYLYVLASGIAFMAYGLDKYKASTGRWRTRESTLHLLNVVGGWPGALLAQSLFRHKSAKKSFQTVFWWTVALNLGLLWWLHSATGSRLLESFMPGR